jgi:hypothetical protein
MRTSAVAATVLLGLALAWSQQADPLLPNASWVEQAGSAPAGVTRGQSHAVQLDFRVKKGYHINSNKPHSEFLIPTTLKLDPPTDIVIGRIVYPPGEDRSFPFDPGSKLNVYTGEFSLHPLVRPLATVRPGAYKIRGELRYQACDDRACYPPKTMPVAFEVQVKKGPAQRTRRNPGQSPHAHQ